MKSIKLRHSMAMLLAIICLCSSCLKEEFMPAPVGTVVPYQDSLPTFYEAFSDPAYSIFLHAWRRSHTSGKVNLQDPKTKFTVLVPDNQAMIAGGYTLDKINKMALNDIDTLVFYHTVIGQLSKQGIEQSRGNTRLRTLLTHPTEIDRETTSSGDMSPLPYQYKVYFGVEGNQIVVNGRPSGKKDRIIESKQATLIPINKILLHPVESTAQFLIKDGRFKLYIQALNYSDSIYDEIQLQSNPFYYEPEGFKLRMNRLSTFAETSLLVPTDDAFKKAGIFTVADIKQLCKRSPVYSANSYGTMSNFSVIDSVVNNHWWQINPWNILATDPRGLTSYHQSKNAFTPFSVFFSNDLKNELLGTIILSWELDRGYRLDGNNLEFDRKNDDIWVRVKGSTHEAAKVIEKDIITNTGVIQVVDRLLLPKGFKLN